MDKVKCNKKTVGWGHGVTVSTEATSTHSILSMAGYSYYSKKEQGLIQKVMPPPPKGQSLSPMIIIMMEY